MYLKVHSRVANGTAEAANNQQAEYVLTSTEKEARAKNVEIGIKKKAFQEFSKMTITEQIDFLKVYQEGKFKVSKSSSPDFIESTVGKIVDEKPQEFLDTVSNPYFKSLTFVQDCLLAGVIIKSGPKYSITGGELIGQTLMDTIQNLAKPEYNEIKVSLLAKLEALK